MIGIQSSRHVLSVCEPYNNVTEATVKCKVSLVARVVFVVAAAGEGTADGADV